MIKIKFKRKSGKMLSFVTKGHAGFDEYNRDIVCSSVSAITQTAIIGVTEVLKINAMYSAEDGLIALELGNQSAEDIDRCQVIMESTLLGLKSMENSYGDYIKVDVEEV